MMQCVTFVNPFGKLNFHTSETNNLLGFSSGPAVHHFCLFFFSNSINTLKSLNFLSIQKDTRIQWICKTALYYFLSYYVIGWNVLNYLLDSFGVPFKKLWQSDPMNSNYRTNFHTEFDFYATLLYKKLLENKSIVNMHPPKMVAINFFEIYWCPFGIWVCFLHRLFNENYS